MATLQEHLSSLKSLIATHQAETILFTFIIGTTTIVFSLFLWSGAQAKTGSTDKYIEISPAPSTTPESLMNPTAAPQEAEETEALPTTPPTIKPTLKPTSAPTATPVATATPTPTPTASPSPTPTATPTPSPSPSPTPTPTESPSPTPTASP